MVPAIDDRRPDLRLLVALPIVLAVVPWLPTLLSPPLIDERVMTFEARKWIGLDLMAPWHLPIGGSGTWRPLSVYAFWLDAGLPWPARHAVQLALHATFVGLAAAWLRGRLGATAACVAACWLAVNPAHAATAGWIGGRPDLLMGVAAAGALLAWDKERWLLASVLTGGAVLFKETGIALLPILLLARPDRKLVGPWAVGLLAFGATLLRAAPEPGYGVTADALGAASKIFVPFGVELAVPWFVPAGVPAVPRDLVGLALAVPVAAVFVLAGVQGRAWRVGVGMAVLALLPVLHVLPNDGGQWYLLLPSVGMALAWGHLAEDEVWRKRVMVLVAVTALLAGWEAIAWHRAARQVDATVDAVKAGELDTPPRQVPSEWPHRGPSFCCGVPYQVLEMPERGWGPILEDG